jgi:protein tyrosine phosphatase
MYIATQFPLESTVNEFWRMIWEKKSNCIIMLADTEENPVRNCYSYVLVGRDLEIAYYRVA